tara:strand:+ start:59 stop:172 length:114 start_codon:yes stop_codon:yes gene_type:complete
MTIPCYGLEFTYEVIKTAIFATGIAATSPDRYRGYSG